jgi:tripeptide aminopeptidase
LVASAMERVSSALKVGQALLPELIDLTIEIAEIPAPTGAEHERSRFVAGWLDGHGFSDIWKDDLGDLTVRIPGRSQGAPVMIAAHLDTVFPAGTNLTVRRVQTQAYGPGVGDNSLGVAALLTIPEMLARLGLTPAVDLILALTVGEEGLGNLRGMRAVIEHSPGLGAAIALEGHNLGRVTHMAVGSRRLRIEVSGPGGHSWGAFGQPSAIHALAKIIAALDGLTLTESPKTTLNVGLIEGGVSVNTIAPSASCVVDMRSTDEKALAALAGRVDQIVGEAAHGGIGTNIVELGVRPAGTVPRDSRLVRSASRTLKALGYDAIYDASSTDANIPISLGIPAVCLGITSGGNAHREDEYIDLPPVAAGLTQILFTALDIAEDLSTHSTT